MKKSSYKVTDMVLEGQFNQTDFGRVYYNIPSEVHHPKSVKELAGLLRLFHKKGVPVTIRNTGHSLNGQTLTDGVQINVEQINHASFDEKKMLVSAGAGASWDSILKEIGFPKYCLPIFPNNPNQEIKIGGTASAGGIGFYSASRGGFWNHVESITLVTMEGEVLECSKKKNSELFRFSLGGYGRVGVIAEVVVRVVPSPETIELAILVYKDMKGFFEGIDAALQDKHLVGVLGLSKLATPKILSFFGFHMNGLVLVSETLDAQEFKAHIRSTYEHESVILFGKDGLKDELSHLISYSLKSTSLHKKNLVYVHPHKNKLGQEQFINCQLWCDYILPKSTLAEFTVKALALIEEYDFAQYGLQHSFSSTGSHEMEFFMLYPIKKDSAGFPLCLDIDEESVAYENGFGFSVPQELVPKGEELIRKMSDLCYLLGGKRYLYSTHSLSESDILQQYGKDTIKKWNILKKQYDPKWLLNLEVIPHVDHM